MYLIYIDKYGREIYREQAKVQGAGGTYRKECLSDDYYVTMRFPLPLKEKKKVSLKCQHQSSVIDTIHSEKLSIIIDTFLQFEAKLMSSTEGSKKVYVSTS